MICPERQRLLTDYSDSASQYSEAVRALVDMISGAVGADIDLLRRNTRKAHEQVEQARLTLFRHEANHFCDRADFAVESK